jgi:SWIM zinc finger
MHVLLERDHRKARASWRKYFKQEWKKLSSRAEDMMANDRYYTDPAKWTCSCPYFLTSRFLICKHIIACYEPIVERVNFFHNVTRSRTSPFWIHPQLVLRPELRPSDNQGDDTVLSDEEDGSEVLEDSEDDASIDAAAADEDHLTDLDDDLEEELNAFESDLQQAVDIFREQRAKGNKKFLERFIDVCRSMRKQVREIIARKNQRTMPRTWGCGSTQPQCTTNDQHDPGDFFHALLPSTGSSFA